MQHSHLPLTLVSNVSCVQSRSEILKLGCQVDKCHKDPQEVATEAPMKEEEEEEMATQPQNANAGSATGNPRNKVALKPGHSLMDWVRLGQSGKDLTGVGGRVSEVTIDQLWSHNRQDDAWICLRGRVYNVTHYMEYHPGGVEELMKGVGTDATGLFNQVHQWVNVESLLKKCVIGHLDSSPLTMLTTNMVTKTSDTIGGEGGGASLDVPSKDEVIPTYHNCILRSKEPVNHNTRLFRFNSDDGVQLSVPIGHHVHFRMVIGGVEVLRSYTPVWKDLSDRKEGEDRNELYFMIKIYEKGTMTPILDALKPGDRVDISDPTGNFDAQTLYSYRHLVLLAAGTGFTPMVKLLDWALFQTEDKNVKLMFFNREEKDILWKFTLDSLSEQNPRLEVCYILSELGNQQWQGPVGHIRAPLLENFLPQSLSEDTLCCVCGPVQFVNQALQNLKKLKFPSANVHAFTAS